MSFNFVFGRIRYHTANPQSWPVTKSKNPNIFIYTVIVNFVLDLDLFLTVGIQEFVMKGIAQVLSE